MNVAGFCICFFLNRFCCCCCWFFFLSVDCYFFGFCFCFGFGSSANIYRSICYVTLVRIRLDQIRSDQIRAIATDGTSKQTRRMLLSAVAPLNLHLEVCNGGQPSVLGCLARR